MPDSRLEGRSADEIYRETVEKVGQGLAIEWAELERRHPELSRRWAALREVEEVGSAFRNACQEAVPPEPPVAEIPRWGPLELLEKIGDGSFGEVYRARDPALDRDVAVKLLRDPDGPRRRRFLLEGRLLAQVDHPGVVRVHGAAEHAGRPGIWMDLARGRPLSRRLEQDGRFTERETLDVGCQIAEALAAVHAAGIVHGDVKAANVLRHDDGRLVLGDFGSSLDLSHGPTSPDRATPLTAAPEVLSGEPADARSDIYSLGVLLCHLLTADYPVTGEDLAAIRRAQRRGELRSVRELRPDVSAELAMLIERALAFEPQRRWQSARQMADALSALAEGRRPGARVRPQGRSVRLVAGLGALALLATVWGVLSVGPDGQVDSLDRQVPAVSAKQPRGVAAPDARIGLYRTGEPQPLRTGDRIEVGDALFLTIRDNRAPLWLYLVNADAEGRSFALFPLPEVEPGNPLPAGDLRLPGRLDGTPQDWVVTSDSHLESFLLVASREPLPPLEKALAGLLVASPERTPADPSTFGPTRAVGGLEDSLEHTRPATLTALHEIAEAAAGEGDLDVQVELLTLRGGG